MTETLTGAPARNYVGGDWREAGTGETYEKRDPWRPSEVTGVFQASGAADARGRRRRCRRGGSRWAALPAPARAALLHKAADAIDARSSGSRRT